MLRMAQGGRSSVSLGRCVMPERFTRWGGIAGIVFVVLIVITIVTAGSPPAGDDSVDKIRAFMVDHRSALLIGNMIGLFGVPFIIWFFVVLREVLRGDVIANALGTASLLGVVLTASVALAGGGVSVAAIYVNGAVDTLGDDSVRIVYETQNLLFQATSAGLVLMSVAAALAIRRTGALPSFTMWLAWLATLGNLATMLTTLGAGAATISFVGVSTFALFVLVTGITLATGKATPPAVTAGA
jgi:hypothetical protein